MLTKPFARSSLLFICSWTLSLQDELSSKDKDKDDNDNNDHDKNDVNDVDDVEHDKYCEAFTAQGSNAVQKIRRMKE